MRCWFEPTRLWNGICVDPIAAVGYTTLWSAEFARDIDAEDAEGSQVRHMYTKARELAQLRAHIVFSTREIG